MGLDGSSLDGVLDAVEEEFLAEETEEVLFDVFGDVGLEVEEIEIGLVVDEFAFGGWGEAESIADFTG